MSHLNNDLIDLDVAEVESGDFRDVQNFLFRCVGRIKSAKPQLANRVTRTVYIM